MGKPVQEGAGTIRRSREISQQRRIRILATGCVGKREETRKRVEGRRRKEDGRRDGEGVHFGLGDGL